MVQDCMNTKAFGLCVLVLILQTLAILSFIL